MKPLCDLLVLDFSQFLSGPSAALRLSDLGARVIKIERPESGDICRSLYISNLELDGDSTLFHSINRNKEGIALDLKDPKSVNLLQQLIAKADILIENFRPGVMKRLDLDYETVKQINPSIIYGEITGYGYDGPWASKPGQDLLVQSLSGLGYLNGNSDQPPVPFGLSVIDMMAGAQLTQGILACLVQRSITGNGSFVQVSLLEAALDLQFEVLTTYLNDQMELPKRSAFNNANVYLGAPYGVYETKDGYLALAMGSIIELSELLSCELLKEFKEPSQWFDERDRIKRLLADHLKTNTTAYWLNRLEPADYWCAEVLSWKELVQQEGFKVLDMVQNVSRDQTVSLLTTRCPIRIDGEIYKSPLASPRIGQDNLRIFKEMLNQV
ncbi:CaiB/BaiF CoA-transferase family protein [Pullulanibacillus sp. KACC 23026]|uniref:CaiB/BaiF CoA transferase family protein n=1 Tax=Pullulanibacillus sp. KACC 23026 TaxID=3028315 RepID=UPI0023B00F7C|nr:CaiB/BaiF CoA-transferase family protein [Pullulanibacillus sp. KACC 23026]WEG11730.1 CaiB/BaiF CoA-transferase family protein [Pullulanibacillus sp. KACC 23026]